MKTGNPNFGRLSKHLYGKFLKLWNSFPILVPVIFIYVCMTLFHCTFHLRLRLTRLWNEISPCNPHVPIPCAHGTHTSLTRMLRGPTPRKARWHPLSNISMRNTTKLYLALVCCHVNKTKCYDNTNQGLKLHPVGTGITFTSAVYWVNLQSHRTNLTISSDINVKPRHSLTDNYFGLVCSQQEKRTHYVQLDLWSLPLHDYSSRHPLKKYHVLKVLHMVHGSFLHNIWIMTSL